MRQPGYSNTDVGEDEDSGGYPEHILLFLQTPAYGTARKSLPASFIEDRSCQPSPAKSISLLQIFNRECEEEA
jgi:hypothetical protein